MKYRKKPVVIEAFRWTGGEDQIEDPAWIVDAIAAGTCEILKNERCYVGAHKSHNICMAIKTLEGIHYALPGDYIIRGVKGELYSCKPDIFEMTYEPVTEPITIEQHFRY